ncbi:MAG TPA: VOC family protein [Candidatus Acidoferrales bacterium]|nr:VOC family protein [Candidatus Acidoferrales bacterium]
MAAPKIAGVLETAIHVEDMKRAVEFYERLFQFERMDGNDRFCAFNVDGRNVFLLFLCGGSVEPVHTSGGVIPPHGGSGALHFAFAIAAADWDGWMKRLEANSVTIESIVYWPLGGRSMYFRDPDNHLVELVTPKTWPIY